MPGSAADSSSRLGGGGLEAHRCNALYACFARSFPLRSDTDEATAAAMQAAAAAALEAKRAADLRRKQGMGAAANASSYARFADAKTATTAARKSKRGSRILTPN